MHVDSPIQSLPIITQYLTTIFKLSRRFLNHFTRHALAITWALNTQQLDSLKSFLHRYFQGDLFGFPQGITAHIALCQLCVRILRFMDDYSDRAFGEILGRKDSINEMPVSAIAFR